LGVLKPEIWLMPQTRKPPRFSTPATWLSAGTKQQRGEKFSHKRSFHCVSEARKTNSGGKRTSRNGSSKFSVFGEDD
jgi:hypothetical protein